MKNKIFMFIIIMAAIGFWFYVVFGDRIYTDNLECRAQLEKEMGAACGGNSKAFGMGTFDFLLSMYGDGQGYLIILGSYTCPGMQEVVVDRKLDFSYQTQGGYYLLKMRKTTDEVKKAFRVFTHREVEIKFTRLGKDEYQVSLPFEPTLVCKKG